MLREACRASFFDVMETPVAANVACVREHARAGLGDSKALSSPHTTNSPYGVTSDLAGATRRPQVVSRSRYLRVTALTLSLNVLRVTVSHHLPTRARLSRIAIVAVSTAVGLIQSLLCSTSPITSVRRSYPYATIQQPQNSPWALLLSFISFEHTDVLVRAS